MAFFFTSLGKQGIPKDLFEIMKQFYKNLKARIIRFITHKRRIFFDIKRGVKQGNILSLPFRYTPESG